MFPGLCLLISLLLWSVTLDTASLVCQGRRLRDHGTLSDGVTCIPTQLPTETRKTRLPRTHRALSVSQWEMLNGLRLSSQQSTDKDLTALHLQLWVGISMLVFTALTKEIVTKT